MPFPLTLIGGPTASGKTALALALAARLPAPVIINADALQMYADLAILSARPSAAELEQAPHQLFGVWDGAVRGSVGQWLPLARHAVTQALAGGQQPILVGGTGLYLRAFIQGLAPVPEVAPEVVAAVSAELAACGSAAFKQQLCAVDAKAEKISSGDPQRLIRAAAVLRATGQPLSYWQSLRHDLPPEDWQFHCVAVTPPREPLYARCNARFAAMLAHGALAEVKALLQRALPADLPIMKAVGVPELAAHVRADYSLTKASAAAQQATRNYAKRQLTWFRHQWPQAGICSEFGEQAAALASQLAANYQK